MADLKVALIDRRNGVHGGNTPNNWNIRKWANTTGNLQGGENTYALIAAFGEVMMGMCEAGTDFQPLTEYDIIYMRMRNPNEELPHIKRMRETCPKPKIIIYTDEWVNFKTEDLAKKQKWKEVADTVDAITCGFGKKYTEEIFKGLDINNFYHLPYAGDVRFWKTKYKPYSKKGNYITGMWHLRSFFGQGTGDLKHTDTFNVLQHLCKTHGVGAKFFLNFDGRKHVNHIREYLNKISFKCELITHVSNAEFDEIMSKSLLFYEEYPTPAYSRATVVSACVGTPSISNYLNDPSRVCFPELTVNNKDINAVKRIGDKLLSDAGYWKEQAKYGREAVEYYNYPAYRDRIIQLVDTL